jgi:hypothetical protein
MSNAAKGRPKSAKEPIRIYSLTVKRLSTWIIGTNQAAAVRSARKEAYGRGYIGTHLVRVVPAIVKVGQADDPGFLVTLALESRRVRPPVFESWGFSRGMAVRTKADGFNHAGGQAHVMPAGSLGRVSGRLGDSVRVHFEAVSGHSFLYSPADLEILDDVP